MLQVYPTAQMAILMVPGPHHGVVAWLASGKIGCVVRQGNHNLPEQEVSMMGERMLQCSAM
jgi:hypothetical protein